MTGRVITANPDKGYFFVRPVGGTNDDNHFCHIRDWGEVFAVGAIVEFESRRNERGIYAVPENK